MMMSSSSNDNEALTSLRTAYKIITNHGYTWEMLLRRQIKVLSEVEGADEDIGIPTKHRGGDADDLNAAIELALSDTYGSFRETLLSIQEQYSESGRLSPRQTQVVRDAAERAAARHPGGRVR